MEVEFHLGGMANTPDRHSFRVSGRPSFGDDNYAEGPVGAGQYADCGYLARALELAGWVAVARWFGEGFFDPRQPLLEERIPLPHLARRPDGVPQGSEEIVNRPQGWGVNQDAPPGVCDPPRHSIWQIAPSTSSRDRRGQHPRWSRRRWGA